MDFGVGVRNEGGERMIQFCAKYNLVIGNTQFKNHYRRRYTWKSPGNEGRYQIDYIITKQRFRNQILGCKTYPGADILFSFTLNPSPGTTLSSITSGTSGSLLGLSQPSSLLAGKPA